MCAPRFDAVPLKEPAHTTWAAEVTHEPQEEPGHEESRSLPAHGPGEVAARGEIELTVESAGVVGGDGRTACRGAIEREVDAWIDVADPEAALERARKGVPQPAQARLPARAPQQPGPTGSQIAAPGQVLILGSRADSPVVASAGPDDRIATADAEELAVAGAEAIATIAPPAQG